MNPASRSSFPIAVILLAMTVMGASACNNGLPTVPSPIADRTRIENLQVRQLGLTHALCGTGPGTFQYVVHDELVFDIKGQTGALFVGGTLHHVQEDGSETQLGTVAQCTESVTPCSATTSVCLTKSASGVGQIRAYTRVAWTPERRWNLFLRSAATDSNRIAATIARPDDLPFGDTAAIAFIDALRSSTTSGSFNLLAFSPGISGRRISLTREVWSNGVRLSSSTSEFAETTRGVTGTVGGITISAAPSELVGILEERDASGAVIATDRKSTFFR